MRAGFDCGVERLNNYLHRTAKKHQNEDLTRVYVALREGDDKILGYHAINMGSMDAHVLGRPLKNIPSHGQTPIMFLGQIAVAISAQKKGLGSILLAHVFEKARVLADDAGCHAIVLDVMSDGEDEAFQKRMQWYRDRGFEGTPSSPSRMFITMRDVRANLEAKQSAA